MTDHPRFATVSPAWGPVHETTVQSDAWLVGPAAEHLSLRQPHAVFLLSLVGSARALRRIQQAFLDDRVELALTPPQALGRRLTPLMNEHTWQYRRWSGRLVSGAAHLVLAAERAPDAPDSPRLVFARSAEALPTACFEALAQAEPLMAFPTWTAWLYQRLIAEHLATRLTGPRSGPAGVLLYATETDLDRLITDGLRHRVIAFPDGA